MLQGGSSATAIQIQSQGTISIGNNAVAQTVNIGNGTGATAVAVSCGSGTCGFGNNGVDHSTTIGSITGTSLTTIQGGTGGINIGTGNVANTIAIGTATAGTSDTVNINNTTNAGSVNIGAGMTTGAITIGGTGLQVGTITLGGGTGAQIVNLATGGTGIKTVHIADSAVANVITLGSTTGAASTTIQSGTGNINLKPAGAAGAVIVKPGTNSASAFQVQPSASTTPVLDVDTTNNRIGINTAAPNASLEINSGVSNTSGIRFTQLNSTSTGATNFTGILGLDTQGNVGLSQATVSLTSPALAYWDGLNDPATGSQAYPAISSISGAGTGATSANCATGSWAPTFVAGSGEELTTNCGNQSGSINWNFSQVSFEETQFQFKAGGGNGADSTWFYSYSNAVPTSEFGCTSATTSPCSSYMTAGYLIYFSEWHHCVGIVYGSYTDGNQCNSGGANNPLKAADLWNIGDNNFHDVDIQLRYNTIIVRWDGNVVLTYTDVFGRDLSSLGFGFGSRTGGSNNQHYIKGLLVTKLGSDTARYGVDKTTPMGGNLYMDNTVGANRLGIGTQTPDSTLETDGTASFKSLVYSTGTVSEGTGTSMPSCSTTGPVDGTHYINGSTIIGSGTTFPSNVVGNTIILPDGATDTITGWTDGTHLTVAGSRVECSGNYQIVTDTLRISGTTSPLVNIGDATTDTTQTLLQLDSFSTLADTATCGSTTNQGAMYYNTNSNEIRACINASWQALASTEGLNAILFGVIPDSGTTPGDLAGVNGTDASEGPCKVYMGSANNTIRWTGCTVYSQGRKQVIAAQSANFSTGITTTAGQYQNLCIFTSGNAPSFGTAGTITTATLPAWSATAPGLCLASITEKTGGSGISAIFDTRVFTTSTKELTTIATAAPPGYAVKLNGTIGQVAPTAATTDPFFGVVAAFSGTTQTTAINAIVVTSGPVYVRASAGSVGAYIRPTATAGVVNTTALVTAIQQDIPYNYLGLAQSPYNAPGTTQCSITANADTCRGSILTNINVR
jgi:hypothetical protein